MSRARGSGYVYFNVQSIVFNTIASCKPTRGVLHLFPVYRMGQRGRSVVNNVGLCGQPIQQIVSLQNSARYLEGNKLAAPLVHHPPDASHVSAAQDCVDGHQRIVEICNHFRGVTQYVQIFNLLVIFHLSVRERHDRWGWARAGVVNVRKSSERVGQLVQMFASASLSCFYEDGNRLRKLHHGSDKIEYPLARCGERGITSNFASIAPPTPWT